LTGAGVQGSARHLLIIIGNLADICQNVYIRETVYITNNLLITGVVIHSPDNHVRIYVGDEESM